MANQFLAIATHFYQLLVFIGVMIAVALIVVLIVLDLLARVRLLIVVMVK